MTHRPDTATAGPDTCMDDARTPHGIPLFDAQRAPVLGEAMHHELTRKGPAAVPVAASSTIPSAGLKNRV
jgi:hypothetical protein